jgi:hypothetical protein
MNLETLIQEAQDRQAARDAEKVAAETARLNTLITGWTHEAQQRAAETFGADLLAALNPLWLPGRDPLYRIRAVFDYAGRRFELVKTGQSYERTKWELLRVDDGDAPDWAVGPRRFLDNRVDSRCSQEELRDGLLCLIAELAAAPGLPREDAEPEPSEYELVREAILEAFTPQDDDLAEVALLINAVHRAANQLRALGGVTQELISELDWIARHNETARTVHDRAALNPAAWADKLRAALNTH